MFLSKLALPLLLRKALFNSCVTLVSQSCQTLRDPMDCSLPWSSNPWNSPSKNTGVGSCSLLQEIFPRQGSNPDLNTGIEPRSPALRADSLPVEPQGKPQNTGVGSLSLLQQIFPTQESNKGLLHCRRILYQLNYWGSPPGKFMINSYHYFKVFIY